MGALARRRGRRTEGQLPDGRMALVEHLRELRNRLGISLLALAVCVVVGLVFREQLFDLIKQPYCTTSVAERAAVRPGQCDLFAFDVFSQFSVSLRIAFIVGVIASAPVWLYQLGAFITPGLHRHERRYAAAFLCSSLLLFTTGVAFAYLTLSRGLDFLLSFGGGEIVPLTSINSYLSFVTLTLLAFGVGFLFPVIVLFLHVLGVFPAAKMRSWRRGMVLGIAVATALITPSQDPITFLAMALPLYVLYESCILVARVRERRQRGRAAVEPGSADLELLGDDEISFVDERPSVLEPVPGAEADRDVT